MGIKPATLWFKVQMQSTELHQPGLRHIIIKRPKVKDKERVLKAREKKLITGRLPDGRERGRMGEEVRKLRMVGTE